ncbi:hypothetical protein A3Q56_08575, partial [Intoshia linei]
MKSFNIAYRPNFLFMEYLSSADERSEWAANGLPIDDIYIENFIIIQRSKRYPLIIDPNDGAINFLMKHYATKKITKTSFLDISFRKKVESSLRFGNTLLIEDVEYYDPILNPILNRELVRTGGRVLITIGNQEIDFSPTFFLILSTQNPNINISRSLCSRVTIINFTPTIASLRSNCLYRILDSERTDIEMKRRDLIKLQGEYSGKLRKLENELLYSLSETKTKILDDDRIIERLETLKSESKQIIDKKEQNAIVQLKIFEISQSYKPISDACSDVFFLLKKFGLMHHIYKYSLKHFLDLFDKILQHCLNDVEQNLVDRDNYDERLNNIKKKFFKVILKYYMVGFISKDRILFAMELVNIFNRHFLKLDNVDEVIAFIIGQKFSSNRLSQ